MNSHSNGSFQSSLSESLKNFNTDAVNQLQNYIELCNLIKKDSAFDPDSGSYHQQFISLLLRELVAQAIIHTKRQESGIEEIFNYVRTIIAIMEDTVCILYNLNIKDSEMSFNFSNMNEDRQSQIESNSMKQQQHSKIRLEFLNRGNYYTLISSIVFSNSALYSFLVERIKSNFTIQFKEFKEKSTYTNSDLIKLLKHEETGQYKIKTNLEGLFGNNKEDNYNLPNSLFPTTIKFMNKINKKPEPILKLKIISEMERQAVKQFTKLQAELQMDLLYDRSTSKIISCWLLNRQKKQNIQTIVSMIITYAFIHLEYRLSKKGSSIICFVEQIENILKWKIPCE